MENLKKEVAKVSYLSQEQSICFKNLLNKTNYTISLTEPADEQFVNVFSSLLSEIEKYSKKSGELFSVSYPDEWDKAGENELSVAEEIIKEFCVKINSDLKQISLKIDEINRWN